MAMKRLKPNAYRFCAYMSFKAMCLYMQEAQPIKLDVEAAEALRDKLETIQEEKLAELVRAMPKKVILKKVNRPKVFYKKDGTLSAAAAKFEELRKKAGQHADVETFNVVDGYEDGNPKSTPQIKDWLFSLGWEPCTYKYNRNKLTGEEKRVEQVRVTQPGHPDKGMITPSVKILCDKTPELKALDQLGSVQHRLGVVKAFLSHNENGYVVAGAEGFTNTMRLRHKNPVLNLPKVDVYMGEEIRSLLISGDQEFIGADMVSLESTTKRHYMKPYDPEYADEMGKEGFDEHLDLAKFEGEVTQEDIDAFQAEKAPWVKPIRTKYKPVNYSCVYGVKELTLSRQTGFPFKVAKKLIESYWKRNWSVKAIVKDVRTKTLRDGSMWLFNPVSKFWYTLRHEKDIFSTLNQGTGVYCFDTWLIHVTRKGYWPVMQYHDEALWINKQGLEDKLHEAIREANDKLQLNVSLSVDPAVGINYAEVH